jgi:RimJ/RimL family protein N-acetyltransferase
VGDALNLGVALRPWAAGDLGLLERLLGDPGTTQHLGGPATPAAIRARHERYLAADPARHGLYAIVLGPEAEAVGWVGYWESEWQGEAVWECGWHVVAEHQGRGVATRATALLLDRARRHGVHRHMHAFPSVDNVASNALCRTLGFTLLGEAEVEYPVGTLVRSSTWRLDLTALTTGPTGAST